MHIIMPIMYPNRCDNEAFLSETIDLTNVDKYLEAKNAANPEYKYKFFQFMVAAMLKVLTLRPKMNRFIANMKLYQRNEVNAAFTIKKEFKDESDEALAIINAKPSDTFDSIHDEIYRQVSAGRSEKKDTATDAMDSVNKLPGFLIQLVGVGARFLDKHGWMPKDVAESDPYQHSMVISNLGSIHLHAGYHHLTNWGTTSVFVVVGEIKKRHLENEDGTTRYVNSVDITLTVDERIADGYYYARSVSLLRKLMECPELLDQSLDTPVEY